MCGREFCISTTLEFVTEQAFEFMRAFSSLEKLRYRAEHPEIFGTSLGGCLQICGAANYEMISPFVILLLCEKHPAVVATLRISSGRSI